MTRCLILLLALAPAQEKKATPRMDYGPFLAGAYTLKPGTKFDNGTGHIDGPVVSRGIAVKLGENWESGAVFDADTLRMAGAWTGGAPKWTGVIFDGAHGPTTGITVPPAFLTPIGPGWAKGGSWKDPRSDSIKPLPPPGPLPRDWAKYRGLYRHGDQTVFSYTVGKTAVLETVALEDGKFARTFRIEPSDEAMQVLLSEGDAPVACSDGKVVREGGLTWLEIAPRPQPALVKAVLGGTETPKPADLAKLTKGGPARWGEAIETKGAVSPEPGPYVVDRLTLPEPNPWRAKMRVGGFDFFADGARAALCTWDGDVWIVSGIDEKLEKLSWKRFATGLYQPLGLRIVDDLIYAVGHDQITRLHDLNGDGEADFYENFNNDWELTTAFHTFCFDLQTDPQGNFYFAFNAPVRGGGGGFHRITSHHGTILKVSKDGSTLDVFATGFRANNGIGVGPNGEVTSGDNEGTWVPKCPLHWVKPGSFNGVVDAAHREMKSSKGKPDPAEEPKPVCWMPKNVDNSGGGQVWVTSDRWGPFRGELLHMSYGTSSLYKVLMEEVGGVRQGGVVKFPLRFTSSAMRARFNPKDGQLYVAGLRGWQSNAAREGGLDRVRYTGAPVFMPTGLKATKTGLAVTFTGEVDPAGLEASVSVWNYRWTSAYGSGEYSTDPEKKDGKKADALEVKSAALASDRRTLLLEVAGLKPVHQMRIALRAAPAGGKPASFEIHNTIHALGD
jgi:glucose/arabinose dehydrogenase